MSHKSFVGDPDIESQQENLLVDAGGARRSISTTKKTAIKACAVDDQDVERQQLARLNTGETVRRQMHLLYLVTTAVQGFISAANDPVTEIQLETGSSSVSYCYESSLQEFGGVQGVAEALGSDMAKGISGHEEDLHHRLTALLKPESEARSRNFIHFLRKSFDSSTIVLLLILAILSFVFGIKEKGLRTGWYEGALILGAVILIVIVQSVCEFRNESSCQLSRNQLWQNGELKVPVLRGGCSQTICITDVLLGDIVLLEKGDQVPADGLLIPTESLEVDDKANPIINDQNPFLFYGSIVTHGTGKMLVTSVGAKTKLGNMLSTAPLSKGTKVEEQLNKLSTLIQIIGIVNSIIITVVLFLWFELKKKHENPGLPDISGKPHPVKELIEAIKRVVLKPGGMLNTLTSFTLLLVGIAEGLPLAIAIAINCWNKRMLGDKTFAQEPSITVTMASVNIICTDETGGLTLTPPEVERCWIGEEVISKDSEISNHVQEAFCDGIGISSLSPENSQTPVDNSILSWAAEQWGFEMDIWKQRHSIIKSEQPTHNENIVAALIGKERGNGPRYLHFRGPRLTQNLLVILSFHSCRKLKAQHIRVNPCK